MMVKTSTERYITALGVLVFVTTLMVLAAPATATENKLLFVPQHSTATGYGGCVDVDIYTDINETDQAIATQFDIEYDPNCVQDCPSFDNTSSGWLVGPNASVTYSNPASGICRFTTILGPPNPPISGHIYVGTLTLCCNNTSCEGPLNFTNALYVKGDMNSTSPLTDSGTFQCEEEPDFVCGDCDQYEGVTTNDGWLIYMNLTFPGDSRYAFTNAQAADCDIYSGVTTNDGWLIYMNLTFPGNSDYVLRCD